MNIYFLLLTPLVISLFFFIFKLKGKFVERIAVLGGLVEFGAALSIAFGTRGGDGLHLGEFLHYDALASWFLLITATLGMFGLIYSVSYLRRESHAQGGEADHERNYYALFHLFLLAMFVAVAAENVLLLWIAVEATTLTSAFLVNFFDRPTAIEAAWRYMIINTVALLLGLFGVFLFVAAAQHGMPGAALDWASLMNTATLLDPALMKIAFVFMLIGYGTKMGLAPLHNWLPDAHSQAPSPVSALLSGALLNVAFLALLRFKGVVDAAVGRDFSETILVSFGVLSIVIASALILIQKQYKRLLAYSSVEHMGIIAVGCAVGGVGAIAGLLHALYHSLAKGLLFVSSGNILLRYRSSEIREVKGLLRALPYTGFFFVAGLLAVAGMPPFGTFLTEFAIFGTAFGSHSILITIAIIALGVAFVGIMRHITAMCFGDPEHVKRGEDDKLGVFPIVALFVVLFVLSIWRPDFLLVLLEGAARNI